MNSLQNLSPSPRDDIESIGYLLVYLIRGDLPWIKENATKREILQSHRESSIEQLC